MTEAMASGGHEQVVFASDVAVGLRVIIAVHSTALGPALGGIRFWRYDCEDDALLDALRLSEAMTLKAAAAGLHQGGGKAVVLVDDPDLPRSPAFLHALGRSIHDLGGRYLAAEDVGATTRDMDLIAEVTPWVTGIDPARGGSGDPSPMTAVGVVAAMRAALAFLDGGSTLAGRRIAVQGAGHVGAHLVARLAEAGASVVVADVNPARARAIADANGVEVVHADEIIAEECDVLAPCALGSVVTCETVTRLRCRAICGAANNQLGGDAVEDLLVEHGIVSVPDFVANAGGIINIAEEFTGYSRGRALERTERIGSTVAEVLELARAQGLPPGRVATRMARARIALEGDGRRWEPGDPAAWTGGAPLRSLRPSN